MPMATSILAPALNKVLKDIIVKSRNMMGYRAEYVPGWDCHGLPIELKAENELGGKKGLSVLEVRRLCREFALKYLDIQREEFKRLGVFGQWDKPYMTMNPVYEAATARELGKFMQAGSVARAKKPIHWCCSCETALAEAEVEYDDHSSPSIYVRFPLTDEKLRALCPQADPAKSFIVIWTTTPWTLPDNMAVAVHPECEYVVLEKGGEYYVVAEFLSAACQKIFGWDEGAAKAVATVKGAALEGLVARHPFYDRPSPVVTAAYVTLDTGTGCVHTAPGHGREDYETGLRYGLEILSPLDDKGRFLRDVQFFAGLNVFQANPKVIEKLQDVGNLMAQAKLSHSYPHCWRCKKPVIFRATTQWFISMEANDLRAKALDAIDNQVEWIPAWGRERIHSMIEFRPDWCISRQRMWGVPIVALLCKDCDEAYYDTDWVMSVVDKFEAFERGCDWWFEAPLEDIVPQGLKCPKCGGTHWKKETDILDVWFDSGTSFAAVLEKREECRYPANMYLEGSDQHRGWFHSSLLASVGTRGQAPYRSVLTHGYVVDGNGRKMSKSIGNVVAPQQIIDKYGAEVLRIWVASVDYTEDVRISDEILNRQVDAYRRVRNTCRFLLGNLGDFTPHDVIPTNKMLALDRYALTLLENTHRRIEDAYRKYEFHKVLHTIHNYCVTDLSSFYMDILKDRLYASPAKSRERRSAQTAIWRIVLQLIQDMAPIMSFTAEEVFSHMPEVLKPKVETVFALRSAPEFMKQSSFMEEDERQAWDTLSLVRAEVTKAIEPFRKSGEIGHSLDVHVTLYGPATLLGPLNTCGADLREVFIVSKVSLADAASAPADAFASEDVAGLKVGVARTPGEKCQRCWVYSENLGTDPAHPDICPRCTDALRADRALPMDGNGA